MAGDKPPLTVIRSPAAIDELQEIWQWNARFYSVNHADEYLRFLQDAIANLGSANTKGRQVIGRPDLRYIIVRRRARRHGHVAVYNFNETEVHLLHVFHTAQDWQTRLAEELE